MHNSTSEPDWSKANPAIGHRHVIPSDASPDPEEQEYTTYWTPNGFIAITKAEAKRRMQADMPYIVHELNALRAIVNEIHKTLKEAMPDILKIKEIHEIISASGTSGEELGQREDPLGRSWFRKKPGCTCLLCNPRES